MEVPLTEVVPPEVFRELAQQQLKSQGLARQATQASPLAGGTVVGDGSTALLPGKEPTLLRRSARPLDFAKAHTMHRTTHTAHNTTQHGNATLAIGSH